MKKVLLAVDCSEHSRRAGEYLASFLPLIPESQVIIALISSGIPTEAKAVIEPANLSEELHEVHGDEDFTREMTEIEEFLHGMKALFVSKGISEERVLVETKVLSRGVETDIIDLASDRVCDTIVLGRRRLSGFEAIFSGRVSGSVMRQTKGRAVLVVE